MTSSIRISELTAAVSTDGSEVLPIVQSSITKKATINQVLRVGSAVQAWDQALDDIAALAVTDGNIIVGNGTNWVAESGATARASLGLTIGTDVQAYSAAFSAYPDPTANDADSLGSSGTAWSDLFLASGAVINFAAGDVTVTHSANKLDFAGATTYSFDTLLGVGGQSNGDPIEVFANANAVAIGVRARAPDDIGIIRFINNARTAQQATITGTSTTLQFGIDSTNYVTLAAGSLSPFASDATALGTTSLMWSDLFLASGSVVNFNNGDVTLTHSSNALTLGGGSLMLPDAGLTVGASIPFSDASGTLTLQNVDALDATTESTIEAAIDTLANLTSIQGRTVTLADAGANAIFGWDDTAGAYENLTASEATAVLNAFTGDSGSGGVKGLVPAPASGDAAASKFLKADGTWAAPTGTGDVVGPAASVDNEIALFSGTTGKLLKRATTTGILKASSGVIAAAVAGTDYQAYDADLASWANVTRASGFDTFAATPSSANLASLVTDETGSGALVFGTSPTFTTSTLHPAGSVGSPSIAASGDTNTGVWFPAADTIAASTAGSERMRIDSSGKVGVGISSPNAKFVSVETIATNHAASFQARAPGTAQNQKVGYSLYPTFTGTADDGPRRAADIWAGFTGGWGTEYLAFGVGTGTTNDAGDVTTERMRIDGSGNVGIGTTPSTKFHVSGTTRLDGNVESSSNVYIYSWSGGSSGQVKSGIYLNGSSGYTTLFAGQGERVRIDANGNVLIGTTTSPTSAAGAIALKNGTAPTASLADGVILYSEDVAASAELKVRDEAGNVTTLSPHNFSLIPEGPSEDLAWAYYSERGGRRINVDMLKLARVLERVSGEKLVYIEEE